MFAAALASVNSVNSSQKLCFRLRWGLAVTGALEVVTSVLEKSVAHFVSNSNTGCFLK